MASLAEYVDCSKGAVRKRRDRDKPKKPKRANNETNNKKMKKAEGDIIASCVHTDSEKINMDTNEVFDSCVLSDDSLSSVSVKSTNKENMTENQIQNIIGVSQSTKTVAAVNLSKDKENSLNPKESKDEEKDKKEGKEDEGKEKKEEEKKDEGKDKKEEEKEDDRNIKAYPADCKTAPFVLIDTSNAEVFKKYQLRDGIYFANGIKGCDLKNIKTIEMVSRNLAKITFKCIKDANDCVNNEKLKNLGLKPYIPRSAIETYGVVRGVPEDLTDKEIMENMESDLPISFVYRFTKPNLIDPKNRLPTTTVKIGFQGDVIPKYVYIWYVRCPVEHYIPPLKQCNKCGRIGHARATCNSLERCIKCGADQVHEHGCPSQKCILCGAIGHNSTERKQCPKWDKELKVHEIKTLKKISRRQALELIDPTYDNRFAILGSDEREFPALGQDVNLRDTTNEVNRMLTKEKFSYVARKRCVKKAIRQYEKKKENEIISKTVKADNKKQPEQRNIPVWERKEYQYTSEMERLISELLKMTHFICNQQNDKNLSSLFERIKNQFQSIKNNYDVDRVQGPDRRNSYSSDEDSTI